MKTSFSVCRAIVLPGLLGLASVACGGSTPPPSAAAAEPSAEPVASAPAPEAEKAPPADAPSKADTAAPSKSDAKPEPDPNAVRDITYVIVPEGLKITVAGVKFVASASAVQVGAGWGAKVSLEATAEDDKPHTLMSPKAGPIAFAGTILRKGKSEPEHFGDERDGDGEQAVTSDKALKLSRTWPPKGVKVLAIGDTLDLQVALWGLGADKDSRRPVKQFCHVKLEVGKGKPRALIEPPASASGK